MPGWSMPGWSMPGWSMSGWRATRAVLAADRARLLAYFGTAEPLCLHPGYVAVALHRLAHLLRANGWRRTARLLRLLNLMLTGADLDPAASIGKGVVIPTPQAITVCGTLGENCTIMAHASIGWATGVKEAGVKEAGVKEAGGLGAAGTPVIGSCVTFEPGALVLGPVTIGDRVRIGARCLVTTDLPDDTHVLPLDWRSSRL
jgi:serine O-acetyltransferase